MWMIINCKNGVSSYEVDGILASRKNRRGSFLHRLREVMQDGDTQKLSGEIEADETFVGGKLKNMHRRSKRAAQTREGRLGAKTIVLGLLQREGRVRAAVAPSRHKHELHSNILANVEPGSKVYTDEFPAYDQLPPNFTREVVNHMEAYVREHVSTNQIENF